MLTPIVANFSTIIEAKLLEQNVFACWLNLHACFLSAASLKKNKIINNRVSKFLTLTVTPDHLDALSDLVWIQTICSKNIATRK